MKKNLLLALVVLAALGFVLTLPSCYSIDKAKKQHAKAVTAYPIIEAESCSEKYPCKDSIIKGDSVLTFDTLYVGGENMFDTIVVNDTIRITKVVKQPKEIITKTVRINDTIRVLDQAKLDLCNKQRDQAINNETAVRAERDKFKASRNKWRKQAIGLYIVLALGLFAFIYRKIKKPISLVK